MTPSKFPKINQNSYNKNPNCSGWFILKKGSKLLMVNDYYLFDKNEDKFIHLKNGLLHQENGPAVVTGDRDFIQFFMEGQKIKETQGVALRYKAEFKDGIFCYDGHISSNEYVVDPNTSSVSGYTHSLDGPSIIKRSSTALFKDGKYIRPKGTKKLKEFYYIEGRFLTKHEFYTHPDVIRRRNQIDISNKLKSI